jgi:hypothetical protein
MRLAVPGSGRGRQRRSYAVGVGRRGRGGRAVARKSNKRSPRGQRHRQCARDQLRELSGWLQIARLDFLDRLERAANLPGKLLASQIERFAAVLEPLTKAQGRM